MSDRPPRILLVEDDAGAVQVLTAALEREGFRITAVGEAGAALSRIETARPDVVLTDYLLPGLDGVELLRYVQRRRPDLPVVLMTAHGDERLAAEAVQLGAFGYLPKPLDYDELARILRRAVEARRLRANVRRSRAESVATELVGSSPAMREVRELIAEVAPTDATVLILGETGTGKELVARAIHAASRRAAHPFTAVNCAAIPDTLVEAELFGHVRGAYTGADRSREGRLVSSDGGTFFLDEIGDLPPVLQPKLLRFLEEGSVTPLGSDTSRRVSVRFIAATHSDLKAAVNAGHFREDLYYRLNVVPIPLPPLRARREDLDGLVHHLLARLAARHGKTVQGLEPGLMDWLRDRDWAGNVRELENRLERMLVFARDGTLRIPREAEEGLPLPSFHEEKRRVVEDFERSYLESALRRGKGRLSRVSRLTGISPRQLYNLMHKHGLRGEGEGRNGEDGAAEAREDHPGADRQYGAARPVSETH